VLRLVTTTQSASVKWALNRNYAYFARDIVRAGEEHVGYVSLEGGVGCGVWRHRYRWDTRDNLFCSKLLTHTRRAREGGLGSTQTVNSQLYRDRSVDLHLIPSLRIYEITHRLSGEG
jgi:hypothetical protein